MKLEHLLSALCCYLIVYYCGTQVVGLAVPCQLVKHHKSGRLLLDCQSNSSFSQHNVSSTIKNFIQISPQLTEPYFYWVLYPKLDENEFIDEIPKHGLSALDKVVTSDTPLYLGSLNAGATLESLADLTQLRHLRLHDIQWTCLEADSLRHVVQLETLKLTNWRNLSCLHPDSFLPLSRLKTLELSGHDLLSVIDPMVFRPLPFLQRLVLTDIAFTKVPNCQFHNLGSLTTLEMTTLDEYELEEDAFVGLTALKQVRLKSRSATSEALISDLMFNSAIHNTSTFCQLPKQSRLNDATLQHWFAYVHTINYEKYCKGRKHLEQSTCKDQIEVIRCSACGTVEPSKDKVKPRSGGSASIVAAKNSKQQAIIEKRHSIIADKQHEQIAESSFWNNSETKSMIGTVLLCLFAFTVGVLVTLYCWQSKRLASVKKTDDKMDNDQLNLDNKVQLISYRRRDSWINSKLPDELKVIMVNSNNRNQQLQINNV